MSIDKSILAIEQFAGELPPDNEIRFIIARESDVLEKNSTAEKVLTRIAEGTFATWLEPDSVSDTVAVDINDLLSRARDYFISRGVSNPSYLLVTTEETYLPIQYGPTGESTTPGPLDFIECGAPLLPFSIEEFFYTVEPDGILRQGSVIGLTARVRNLGNKPARARVRFYYTANKNITAQDRLIGDNSTIEDIPPLETADISISRAYISNPAAFQEGIIEEVADGSYTFGGVVSLSGGPIIFVPCSTKSDVVTIARYEPLPPRPGAVKISNLTITPNLWDVGTNIVVRFQATNTGGVTSPPLEAQLTATGRSAFTIERQGPRTLEKLAIPELAPGQFQIFRFSFTGSDAAPYLPNTGTVLQAVNNLVTLQYTISVLLSNINFGTSKVEEVVSITPALDQLVRNSGASPPGGGVVTPPPEDEPVTGTDVVAANFRQTDRVFIGDGSYEFSFRFLAVNPSMSSLTDATWELYRASAPGGTQTLIAPSRPLGTLPAGGSVEISGSIILNSPGYYSVRINELTTSQSAELFFQTTPAALALVDDTATVDQDNSVTIDVLANDPTGASILAVSAPANGTAVITADEQITYTPNPGFAGDDFFTYTAGNAETQNSARVSVSVIGDFPDLAINFTGYTEQAETVVDSVLTANYELAFTITNEGGGSADNFTWEVYKDNAVTGVSGTVSSLAASESVNLTADVSTPLVRGTVVYDIRVAGNLATKSNGRSIGIQPDPPEETADISVYVLDINTLPDTFSGTDLIRNWRATWVVRNNLPSSVSGLTYKAQRDNIVAATGSIPTIAGLSNSAEFTTDVSQNINAPSIGPAQFRVFVEDEFGRRVGQADPAVLTSVFSLEYVSVTWNLVSGTSPGTRTYTADVVIENNSVFPQTGIPIKVWRNKSGGGFEALEEVILSAIPANSTTTYNELFRITVTGSPQYTRMLMEISTVEGIGSFNNIQTNTQLL